MSPRRRNPVADDVLLSSHGPARSYDDRRDYRAIIEMAEDKLGIEVPNKVYGCGSYGCAFPTSGGSTLKITLDPTELYLPLHMSPSFTEGYAKILAGPFPTGIERTVHHGKATEWIYYLREGLDPMDPLRPGEQQALDILDLMGRDAITDEPSVYLKHLNQLGQWVQREAPSFGGVYRLLRVLAARPSAPIMFYDLKKQNLGRRRGIARMPAVPDRHRYYEPDVVIFDSQVANP